MEKKKNKLGVIVPYRDRYEHLIKFKEEISYYLESRNIDYTLIIVEQDDAKLFNRGKLLNIGFKKAVKEKCDYVVFHDIDLIPLKVDYSYSNYPVHLATDILGKENFEREIFDSYFGGVTIFPIEDFEIVNGYSNVYWGWGFEDDDLFKRCVDKGLPYDKRSINVQGGSQVSLDFNGTNSSIETKFNGDLKTKTTFVVSFEPGDIFCKEDENYDRYTVLSIPSINFSISYDSFKRYKVLFKDGHDKWSYIDSEILPPHKTTIIVTIDPIRKFVKMYQDGTQIGQFKITGNFSRVKDKPMFIGSKNGKEEFFKGTISQVAVFNTIPKKEELEIISKNYTFSLTTDFSGYTHKDSLIQYFDMKYLLGYRLVDLCRPTETYEIENCEIVGTNIIREFHIKVPNRRKCYFNPLKHESSGYKNGGWTDDNIRYNQLRFHNEMDKGFRNPDEDGLSNLEYKVWNETKVNNQIHLNVGV
jgi:hypothetical protein